MPAQSLPALRPPKMVQVGKWQRVDHSPEWGQRGFQRAIYRPGSLVGTALQGAPLAEIDRWFRDQWETWGQQVQHQRVEFKRLDDGTYEVDVLDNVGPIPDRVPYRQGIGDLRPELRSSLRIVLGWTYAGQPFVSDPESWPHALIGGSTNGGKSYLLMSLLTQMVDKPPSLVRLALADLKDGLLEEFNMLPHVVGPCAPSTPATLDLVRSMHQEMTARLDFLKSPVLIRYPTAETAAERAVSVMPFRELREWNKSMLHDLGRPDLAMPQVLLVVDEWKRAMDGSDGAKELKRLVDDLMRAGRSVGFHVWLCAQDPQKGDPAKGTETFPAGIMELAATRIAMGFGATDLMWRLTLNNRNLGHDKELLRGTRGDIPQGRGMIVAGNEGVPFQGLLIDRTRGSLIKEGGRTEQSSLLAQAQAAATFKPGARLLLERPYAPKGQVSQLVIDLSRSGDEAVQIEYAPAAPASCPARPRTDYTTLFDPPTRADRMGRPRDPNAPYREDDAPDPDDEPSPRRPSQVETRRLEPLTALRFLYRAQIAADAEGRGPIEVSRAKLGQLIRQDGRIAPGNVQLTYALRLLRNHGLLADEGRFARLAYGDWSEARDALRDALDADGPDDEDDPEGPDGASADEATDPADDEDDPDAAADGDEG